jgi:hypothetical protein
LSGNSLNDARVKKIKGFVLAKKPLDKKENEKLEVDYNGIFNNTLQ